MLLKKEESKPMKSNKNPKKEKDIKSRMTEDLKNEAGKHF